MLPPLADVQEEIKRNFRWNFLVNTFDGASFWFGISFISATVILPLYVSHFTDNPLLIGLIPFINTAGVLLPQLFMANAVERAPLKKYFPVNLGFFLERLPILCWRRRHTSWQPASRSWRCSVSSCCTPGTALGQGWLLSAGKI